MDQAQPQVPDPKNKGQQKLGGHQLPYGGGQGAES